MMRNALVKILGWRGTVFHGDTLVFDRWKWLSQKLGQGPLTTLDAGCGSGCFSFYAASCGNHVLGVDSEGPKLDSAKIRGRLLEYPHLNFKAWDLRKLDQANLGTFDQILSFEVIEHIQNDEKLLLDMARLLKPGGRLILTTPYKDYRPLWGDKLSETEDGGHVRWGYTHDEMARMMEAIGLEIVARDYIGGVISQKLTNVMRVAGRLNHKMAWGMTLPLRVLQGVDEQVTKMTDYPHYSIGIVARKKS